MTIRKLLVSAAILATMTGGAWAADLPNTKGPPAFAPPPPPQFTWTGLYVGGQVGYQWGSASNFLETDPGDVFVAPEPSNNVQGIIGGGHIGYNYQINQFVLGIEGDVEGSGASGSFVDGIGGVGSGNARIEGSVRGRVGWAWDRFLIYGTGGVEFASIQNNYALGGLYDSDQVGRAGWTAGGGVEYAFDPNWSIRVEYRYTDYGSYDFPLTNTSPAIAAAAGIPAVPYSARIHATDNRVEAGFSYKFDMFAPPAPVVAKY
jgi:outer membrane immunogenic protein